MTHRSVSTGAASLGFRGVVALFALVLSLGCSDDHEREPAIAMLPASPWLTGATLGAAAFLPEMPDTAIDRTLDELRAENVSAVVARSPDSERYRSELELITEIRLARRVADRAHRRGLRLLWSMPTLVLSSVDGQIPAIAHEHPDWLQLPADDPDGDDVSLCPVGPAREWLLSRVRRLAASGVDALLVTAPELVPLRGAAQLACPEYRAKFRADTGAEVPPRVACDDSETQPPAACAAVWQDPVWRTFLRHRHSTLAELEGAIAGAARESRRDVLTVFQQHAFDTNRATDLGNDASFATDTEGVHRLWDVPVPSSVEGMRRASADDWLQRIAMLKFARGVDRGATSIASSAATTAWDAGLAVGTTFAAQSSPWELRAGIAHAGAGRELRTRAFAWAKAHLPVIQAARSAARVVVLQSSSSRDYVDFGYGSGTFSTFLPPATGASQQRVGPDPAWFAEGPSDGTGALETLGELRGMAKALAHLHVPFDVLPLEKLTTNDLAKYRLVIAPDLVATTGAAADVVREYAARGGAVFSTGLGAWTLDELGRERAELSVGDLFGTRKAEPLVVDTASSRERSSHVEALLGRRYLRYGDELALDRVRTEVERADATPIVTSAAREIYVDLLEGESEMLLSVLNFAGASTSGGASSRAAAKITVEAPRSVLGVSVTSPDPGAVDTEVAFSSPEPGLVSFEVGVAEYSLVRLRLGPEHARRAPRVMGPPTVVSLGEATGLPGHSVSIHGTGFGHAEGKVTWGDEPCTVTAWRANAIDCYVPHAATAHTADIVVHARDERSNASPFTVVAPALAPPLPMKQAFDFIKVKMRSPIGGVFTNFKDRVDDASSNEVYPYGHHQTAEHLGLFLWVAAAMSDHEAFEAAYLFLASRMLSPRHDIVNWAIDKTTGAPMLQRDEPSAPLLNANAPLDDFRVLNGLVAGFEQWKDPRYYWAAMRIGNALFETSTTASIRLPEYPEGVVAYAYNWPEYSGSGAIDFEVIPIDYADLWVMKWLSNRDGRWAPILDANIRLMERALLPAGHFYNSYLTETMALSGDFEFRDTIAGQKVKAIQSLWTAIHLARIGRTEIAQRALDFYKRLYAERGRVAEYLNYDGSECTEPELASTLSQGEARIYAQVVRLAYYLGDVAFAEKVLTEKIVPDQVTEATSPVFGSIGKSSTETDDAEAWNTLESLLAMAMQLGSPVVAHAYR